MINRQQLIAITLVASIALAGCSGWGTNGPAEDGNESPNDTNSSDLEDEQADTQDDSGDSDTGTSDDTDSTTEDDTDSDASDSSSDADDGDDSDTDSSEDSDAQPQGSSDDDVATPDSADDDTDDTTGSDTSDDSSDSDGGTDDSESDTSTEAPTDNEDTGEEPDQEPQQDPDEDTENENETNDNESEPEPEPEPGPDPNESTNETDPNETEQNESTEGTNTSLTVTVIDDETGEPLDGEITMAPVGYGIELSATAENGTATFSDLPDQGEGGEPEYHAEFDSEIDGFEVSESQSNFTTTIVGGQQNEHTLNLLPQPDIVNVTVGVTDAETGEPIEGASVEAIGGTYPNGADMLFGGETGANGSLSTTAAESDYGVTVRADDYEETTQELTVEGNTSASVELEPTQTPSEPTPNESMNETNTTNTTANTTNATA